MSPLPSLEGRRYRHDLTGRIYEVIGYEGNWVGRGLIRLRNVENGKHGWVSLGWLLDGYSRKNCFTQVDTETTRQRGTNGSSS